MGRSTWGWKKGDTPLSFEAYYLRFYRALYQLIYSQIQDHYRTQDLIQETFFRVFQRHCLLPPGQLKRIAGQQIKEEMSYQTSLESLDTLLIETDGEIVLQQTRWPEIETQWCERARIWDVFAHLSPQEQMMLDQRYLDDYTLPQIAESQQIPITLARSRLERARRTFRRKLGRE